MGVFVLIVLCAAIFTAGFFLGRRRASVAPVQTPGPTNRAALAEAWQRGFDAGKGEAARNAKPFAPDDYPELRSDSEPRSPSMPTDALFPRGVQQPVAAVSVTLAPNAQQQIWIPPAVPAQPVDPRVRALRNINITLYVAALLLVAAASLFIALALPATAKVVGLGIVAAGFYVAGLVTHARSERLRPAAAAFAATGLALIPMTGLAHYMLLSTTPGMSWFVTSIIGTAAFIYAAGKLQSRIIAGLATTFLVSTAYSGGAVLNRGLIYYFLFSMLLAAAITLVGFKKPGWISNVYVKSFELAHRYLVPATLAAALASAAALRGWDYGWLFAAACIYYTVVLFAAPVAERYWHQLAARVAGMASLVAFLHSAEFSPTFITRILAATLMLQLVVLVMYAQTYRVKLRIHEHRFTFEVWLLVAAAAIATVLGAEGLLRDSGLTGSGAKLDVNWALGLMLLSGTLIAVRLGGHFRWIPLGTVVLALLEPMLGNMGRQGVIAMTAIFVTWWLARGSNDRGSLILRWAARAVSIFGVGAIFSWAAYGWVLAPGEKSTLPVAEGYISNTPIVERTLEVATLVGVALAFLIQVVFALLRLRVDGQDRSSDAVKKASSWSTIGEALFFTGGLLGASIATGAVSEVLERSRFNPLPGLDSLGAGFSTTLWLGYQWDMILMWLLLAVGMGGATAVLGLARPKLSGTGQGQTPSDGVPTALVHVGGLIALAMALVLATRLNPAWLVEIVSVLGLIYVGTRVLLAEDRRVRVGYAVLAQVLFSATAWHIADRFDMDRHGQYALLAFTVTCAQSARALRARGTTARRPGAPEYLLTFSAVALLLLLPVIYLASSSGVVDQASLLIQNLCLLVFCSIVVVTHSMHGAAYPHVAIPASVGLLGLALTPVLGDLLRTGGWLPSPLWGANVASSMLALLVAGLLLAELRGVGGREYRWVRGTVALLYWGALMILPGTFDDEWRVLGALLGAAGLGIFAATWGIPLLLLGTAAMVYVATERGIEVIHDGASRPGSEPLDTMLGLAASFVILLIAAVLGGRFGAEAVPLGELARRTSGWGRAHARVLFSSALVLLAVAGLVGMSHYTNTYVFSGGFLMLVAIFCAAALEVPRRHRESGFEVACLIAAAVVHRCWWVGAEGTSTFAACCYWIVVLALLAGYEFWRKREQNGTFVLGASAVLLSLTGVGTFLTSTLPQQLVLLLGFTALLIFGLLGNRKIFTVWGAVGIAIAVLWFLRGYTFLLLLLIAVGLIVLALWRLGKMNKGGQGQPQVPASDHPSGDRRSSVQQLPVVSTSAEGNLQHHAGPIRPPSGSAESSPPAPPAGMPWMKPDPAAGKNPYDEDH